MRMPLSPFAVRKASLALQCDILAVVVAPHPVSFSHSLYDARCITSVGVRWAETKKRSGSLCRAIVLVNTHEIASVRMRASMGTCEY